LAISGGGGTTNRSTSLNDQFTLDILAQPTAVPRTPTTPG
jgi:hypothetical protein